MGWTTTVQPITGIGSAAACPEDRESSSRSPAVFRMLMTLPVVILPGLIALGYVSRTWGFQHRIPPDTVKGSRRAAE